MAKRTVDVVGSGEFLRQCAVELERLGEDAAPATLRGLFSEEHGREYYVGLLLGYDNASALDRLAPRVASKVAAARRQFLELHYEGRLVVVGDRKLRLPAVDFAFYAVMALRRLEDGRRPEDAFVAWDTPGLKQEFLHVYRRLTHDWDGNRNRVLENLEKNGIERDWFDVRKSKVNGAIGSLGLLGSAYRIFSKGRPPNKLSGLIVAPNCIRIRDGPTRGSTGGVAVIRGTRLSGERFGSCTTVRPGRQSAVHRHRRGVRGCEAGISGVGGKSLGVAADRMNERATGMRVRRFVSSTRAAIGLLMLLTAWNCSQAVDRDGFRDDHGGTSNAAARVGSTSATPVNPERADDHGDAPGAATFVSSTSTTRGYLESGGDVDWFRFTVPGESRLVVETAGPTDTVGGMYFPRGGESRSAVDDDSGDRLNFRFDFDAEGGDYYVSVRAYEHPGPYSLRVSSSPCAGTVPVGSHGVALAGGFACSYFGDAVPSAVFTFESDREAESIVEQILSVQGLPKNFDVRAGGVPNAAATIACDRRLIIYNQRFIRELRESTGNRWAPVSVMAHEVGHHLSGHTLGRGGSRPPTELQADRFSGFVLQRLGASLADAQSAMRAIGSKRAGSSHPAKHDRLAAIASGWVVACELDQACDRARRAVRTGSGPGGPVERRPDRPAEQAVRQAGAITPPIRIRDVQPVYPPLARRLRMQGAVVLEAVIDPTGIVTDVRVVRSVPLFDDAAVTAVRQWRYSPAVAQGRPVRYTLKATVHFRLP